VTITVVIPTLNEAARIGGLLERLRGLEVIVADGGSDDDTAAIAARAGARLVRAPRGRGSQLHAGACAASGEVLWFVHADTLPPPDGAAAIASALADPRVESGTFRLRFDGGARGMTAIYGGLQRIGLTYGDASIFVRRTAYAACGGFRPLPLFEDTDLIGRLRRRGGFTRLDAVMTASSRRFSGRGAWVRAWALWIALQTLFWLGAPPERLARWYRPAR
jgi:rSAM/selenodomain-associated transferase 2